MTTSSYVASIARADVSLSQDVLLVEIQAPANTTLKIKKIRVMHSDGTQATLPDAHKSVMLITESAAGLGGSSFTPIALDSSTPASAATVKTGIMTKGTVASTIDELSVHSATDLLWQASDEDDKIVLSPGSIFGLVVNAAG